MSKLTIRLGWAAVVLALLLVLGAGGFAGAAPVPDFSFVHISDEHFPHSGTPDTIAELASIGSVTLQPYGVTAVKPSFAIETGDLTEFGPRGGAWDAHEKTWSAVPFPHYPALGNHDDTWHALSAELRKVYGAPYYSFDNSGCHFVVLDTAGLQDPRPTIGPEQIEWLRRDLRNIDPETPLFLAFHHPLDSTEFSGRYEVDRLLDVLRPYNVAAILVGHSHAIRHLSFDGYDMIHGGSSWGPNAAGYQIVSVLDGTLRIAYKERSKPEAGRALLEKPIAAPAERYPVITIDSPAERASCAVGAPIRAWIRLGLDEVKSACGEIDGAKRVDLMRNPGGCFEAVMPDGLAPGAHYLRVSFVGADDRVYCRSVCFYIDSESPRILWRAFLGAASKSTPAVSDDSVFVGTYDGCLRAFDCATGSPRWRFRTLGAVAGEPLLLGDSVIFGSQDGQLYCLRTADGEKTWSFKADDAIYSSPVSDGASIYFGSASGVFYALDAATGREKWRNTEATYTIESRPFVAGGRVYYGAWDKYVYCLDTTDGSLVWKCVGQGSAEGQAPPYYSPADCGPVVAGGKVFAADRKYRLSVIDAASGKLLSFIDKVSAVDLSADGASIYLRKTDKKLAKIDTNCTELWSVDVSVDEVPAAPREIDGVVYTASKRGLVSAVSAVDGKLVWQYQATPSSFVLSSQNADGPAVYVSGTDGSLTAISR